MEYTIGRDAQTRQLLVTGGGKVKRIGQAGSVPMDVSRQHLSLTSLSDGRWQIRNLNNQNVTFVNGMAVESKTIAEGDKVELGPSHYLFPWEAVREPKVETVDIRPLKRVWEEYDKGNLALDIAERKFNVIRSATGIISMSAIACAFIFGQGNTLQLVLYVIAIGISVIFFVIAHNKAAKVPLKRRELKDDFERKWICPKCKRPLNFRSFTVLSQNDACPYCKAKYKK